MNKHYETPNVKPYWFDVEDIVTASVTATGEVAVNDLVWELEPWEGVGS